MSCGDGVRRIVRADRILVCGGTFNSPQVLQRSGTGPAVLLRALDIPVAANLPGVGENLHDQPFALMSWAGSERMAKEMGGLRDTGWVPDEQEVAKAASSFDPSVFDLHFLPYSPTHRGRHIEPLGNARCGNVRRKFFLYFVYVPR